MSLTSRVLRVLGVSAVVGILLSATNADAPAPPPNVLLILVDTLHADRLGVYGDPRGLTPFLDQLASRGTVFANAVYWLRYRAAPRPVHAAEARALMPATPSAGVKA